MSTNNETKNPTTAAADEKATKKTVRAEKKAPRTDNKTDMPTEPTIKTDDKVKPIERHSKLENINVSDCVTFKDFPFRVKYDVDMCSLIESVEEYGVMFPILVRPRTEGGYEVISGHRRIYACNELNIPTVPAIIRELDDDEAVICMVDSNIHRDRILPSEKAFAYKMKVEALSHQGKASVQDGQKTSRGVVAEESGESETQIQRYIRLTNLNKFLLDQVDGDIIGLTTGVELSYLRPDEQDKLANIIETKDKCPTHSKAIHLRKLSEDGLLTEEKILEIMTDAKSTQKEYIKVNVEKYKFYLGDLTPKAREEFFSKALEYYSNYLRRIRNKDAKKSSQLEAKTDSAQDAPKDAQGNAE